jgi:hypothetical protein
MLTRDVLADTMATRALMIRAMLAGAMVASTMLSARVHADVHALVLALVHVDVDGALARVYVDVHVPGVVGNLDVDELVDPVAFGHGFLR